MPDQVLWLATPPLTPRGRAQELGTPICVQMRLAGVSALQQLLDCSPYMRVILDRFARPPRATVPLRCCLAAVRADGEPTGGMSS